MSELQTFLRAFVLLAALPIGLNQIVKAGESVESSVHLSDYVRPLVGTDGGGDTYPGPSALSSVTSKPASRGRIKTSHSKVLYSYQVS